MALNIALNTQKGHISKINIPEYITDNLAFDLREYQKEALARFLYYAENDIWNKTAKYFAGKENNLCEELKLDFAVDTKKILLHDGTNSRIADQPKLLATLENDDNPVRAIFTVNMLQEGWDVLNLFDIVRLYDTRDGRVDRNGNYIAGTGTISEAQLIGRGARYFPFPYQNSDKYKRKFDENEAEPLRA